jgi:predicted enzyme related to lactoylglutathione lyase
MDVDRYQHGVPSWVDVSSPDPARTRDFYASLFGWEMAVGPPEAGGYAIAQVRGRSVAGIGPQMNPAAPPAWTTYVDVDSADDVVERVRANGGTVFAEPMDVMDVGRMAIFADPTGAVIGLWQPGTHLGAQVVNETNTWSWSELLTTDVERDKQFYAAVFGWSERTHGEGLGAYTEFQLPGDDGAPRSIAGMMPKPPMMPAEVPPFWGVYFTVDDVDAAKDSITKLGGTVLMGPADIEPGRFLAATDPTGASFSVIRFNQQPD